MNLQFIYACASFFVGTVMVCDSSRVLFLVPLGSKSHKIFFMGISRALAERGHHVTMVSPFEGSKEIENIKEVFIPDADITQNMTNVFEEGGAAAAMSLIFDTPKYCSDVLRLKEIQDLKKEKFDLVILSVCFDFCFLSLVHHFQVPFIYSSPAGLFGPFVDIVGGVEFASLTPNKFTEVQFPLTFRQRFASVGLNMMAASTSYFLHSKMESICREQGLCPPDMPSFADMNKNVSLAIINSVKALERPPHPIMPNVIYAGGIHMRSPKNLSQDLESWIRESGEDGFIFFSLGSAVTPSFMPEKYRQILINVFGSLKQKVLWKWNEDTMPDLPQNVKLGKWLPQQDILAHSKLKLFITHGGILSTLESTYFGVPIIGMPILGDQFSNLKQAENEGWAKVVHWNQLTETYLRDAILETLTDVRLREISRHRSTIMRDAPVKPSDETVFWVEYVLRHNGAHHLMSPISKMSWCELFNMDIWAIIVGLLCCFLYLISMIFKTLVRLCFGNNKRREPQMKKRKRE